MSAPVFRFAPSPNGRLHLGHAYSALLNERLSREAGGQLLLRLEDIDPVRSRPWLADAIREDLAWLGIAFVGAVRRQSEHMADYADAAGRLRDRGLLFACVCTRGEIAAAVAEREAVTGEPWPRDPEGRPLYPGTCRDRARTVAARRAAGAAAAWRLDTGKALDACGADPAWTAFDAAFATRRVASRPARWGDPVVVRRDVPTSYHLAVVIDDALQGVTHVVRGADLEAATDIHALLQGLLGLPTPRYHHHRLLRDPVGAKLAKSAGSTALADLRRDGATPAEIRTGLGF